jgi:hypothetical protein
MCQPAHIRVTLTTEEKKDARKLTGSMLPVYASILLAVIAVVALGSSPRSGEMIAASPASTATW